MPSKRSEIVDIEVTLIHDSGKAWKVTSHITNKTVWVPHSIAELDTDTNPTILTLPTYIAEEKELV